MENNINLIITLSDNTKYMILDQGNYDSKGYYLTSKLDSEDNLTEEFNILEDNNGMISEVKEENLLQALVKYFQERLVVVA